MLVEKSVIKISSKIISVLMVLTLIGASSPCMSSPFVNDSVNASQSTDRFVTVNDVKLHYVDQGKGQSVVLLHGNDGTLKDFTFSIFDRLATKYRTLAFDRPGHGQSELPTKVTPIPEVQAMLLHEALRKIGVRKPILVAHSWSGAVALSYALLFPNDLSGLVLLGSMAYEGGGAHPKSCYYALQLPLIGTAFALYYKMTARDDIKKQLEAAFMPSPTPLLYEKEFLSSLFRVSQIKAAARDEMTVNRCFRRISPYYERIKMPVVIVVGEDDKIVPPHKNSYPLHMAISQSELIVIPQTGHELQFTQPEKVMEAINLAASTASNGTKISAVPNNSHAVAFCEDLFSQRHLSITSIEDWQKF